MYMRRNKNMEPGIADVKGRCFKAVGRGQGRWSQLSDHLDWCVSVVEEDDLLGHYKWIETSLQMVYIPLLRSHIFLLTFIYLGNVLPVKACRSANKFNRIWSGFTKQVLSLQSRGLNPDPHLSTSHLQDRPKEPGRPALRYSKVLWMDMTISQRTYSSISGLFSLNAFQLDCFLM